ANVVFDNFPANPTTWYIGTYIHLLILWAVALRRLWITPGTIILAGIVEILVRATLAAGAGLFVAYMASPTWLPLFPLGLFLGRRPAGASSPSPAGQVLPMLGLGLLIVSWATIGGRFDLEPSFPFMRIRFGRPLFEGLATSVAVTSVYLC